MEQRQLGALRLHLLRVAVGALELEVLAGEGEAGRGMIERRRLERLVDVALRARAEVAVGEVALLLVAALADRGHAAELHRLARGRVAALARGLQVAAGQLPLRLLVVVEEVLLPRDGAVAEAALAE
jgi:hypothetical protein